MQSFASLVLCFTFHFLCDFCCCCCCLFAAKMMNNSIHMKGLNEKTQHFNIFLNKEYYSLSVYKCRCVCIWIEFNLRVIDIVFVFFFAVYNGNEIQQRFIEARTGRRLYREWILVFKVMCGYRGIELLPVCKQPRTVTSNKAVTMENICKISNWICKKNTLLSYNFLLLYAIINHNITL